MPSPENTVAASSPPSPIASRIPLEAVGPGDGPQAAEEFVAEDRRAVSTSTPVAYGMAPSESPATTCPMAMSWASR